MNNRRMSWIVVLAMGLAAAALILRRRMQIEEELPRLPLPEPPEPPRIVLPRAALEPEETSRPAAQERDEAPRERAVGEKSQGSRASARSTAQPAAPAAPAPSAGPDAGEVTGYCMRCRERRSIVEPEEVVTESGRHAVSGSCAECGTRIFRFVSSRD
jgi:hypothetical protein